MTPQEAAAALDQNEYGKEGSKELFAKMKEAGLVAVFGYSDDNVELRGAINDEIGCYNGGEFFVDGDGLVQNKCDEGDSCPNWKPRGKKIEVIWEPEEGISWDYKTEIPHETFLIIEDGETYCRGIVFKLSDAA